MGGHLVITEMAIFTPPNWEYHKFYGYLPFLRIVYFSSFRIKLFPSVRFSFLLRLRENLNASAVRASLLLFWNFWAKGTRSHSTLFLCSLWMHHTAVYLPRGGWKWIKTFRKTFRRQQWKSAEPMQIHEKVFSLPSPHNLLHIFASCFILLPRIPFSTSAPQMCFYFR